MILTEQKSLVEEMRILTLKVVIPGEAAHCMALQLQSSLIERIKEAQAGDKQLQKFKDQGGWTLRYGVRLCVPKGVMRQALLAETHNLSYSSPRRNKDVSGFEATFLVAWDDKRNSQICI